MYLQDFPFNLFMQENHRPLLTGLEIFLDGCIASCKDSSALKNAADLPDVILSSCCSLLPARADSLKHGKLSRKQVDVCYHRQPPSKISANHTSYSLTWSAPTGRTCCHSMLRVSMTSYARTYSVLSMPAPLSHQPLELRNLQMLQDRC